eukprot:5487201-Amphidinium_carterae.2
MEKIKSAVAAETAAQTHTDGTACRINEEGGCGLACSFEQIQRSALPMILAAITEILKAIASPPATQLEPSGAGMNSMFESPPPTIPGIVDVNMQPVDNNSAHCAQERGRGE